MDKVYIVTAGTYSDYGIQKVFDSLDKAQNYCMVHEDFVWGSMHIEVYKINDGLTKDNLFVAKVDDEGKVLEKERKKEVYSMSGYYYKSDKEIHFVKGVSYKDYDHAIKSARDNLTKLKYRLEIDLKEDDKNE